MSEEQSADLTKAVKPHGWSSRTLISTAVAFATATALCLVGKVDGAQWVSMVPFLLGIIAAKSTTDRFAAVKALSIPGQ